MALLRCSKCNHVREIGESYIRQRIKCPKCQQPAVAHETVEFVNSLIKKYILQNKELYKLKKEIYGSNNQSQSIESIDDINNTKFFAQSERYPPIKEWFELRSINVKINSETVDTTGFFDEIALLLGNNSETLKFVTDQIKFVQNKGYKNVKLDLSKKSLKETLEITSFCKELYNYSFVAKNFYHKKEKVIRLTLQTAPQIKAFFNGIWMEWFILMKLLEFFRSQYIEIYCMRNLNISFKNGDSNELDIFFLTENNKPVYIECISGEFRQDIEKYLKLKQKLMLEKDQFILCIFDLSQKQATGMSSMYDLTFVNEANIIEHIAKITRTTEEPNQ